jgi:hypothetical protein
MAPRPVRATTTRVISVRGIFARAVAVRPLDLVTDLKHVVTPLGRVLGYGALEIESSGKDDSPLVIDLLPNSLSIFRNVTEALGLRKASGLGPNAGRP